MTDHDFWESIHMIINRDFDSSGLEKLDEYADKFINGQLLFNRFSPQEQHGCSAGGPSHVIASILSRAEDPSDSAAKAELRTRNNH